MKKIITTLLSLFFVVSVMGQIAGNTPIWLNYGVAINVLYGTSAPSNTFLFPDSTVLVNYDNGPLTINPYIHEIGNIFDAYSHNLQKGYGFQLTSTKSYTLDSMGLSITYTRHTANSIVDTLLIYLFQSTYNSIDIPVYYFDGPFDLTNYGYDTVYFADMYYNYKSNALSDIKAPISTIKIPLTKTDTSTVNFYTKKFALPASMNVTAGNLVACAMSFKPGYTYTVGENVDSFANTLNFESLDEHPGGYPYYFPGDNNNMSYIIDNTVRHNIDPEYDGLFIPSLGLYSSYTFDDHQIFYHIIYYAPLVIEPQDTTVCNGAGATLTVGSKGSNFTWSPSTGLSATTGSSVVATPTATTTYTITGLNSYGNTAIGYDTVTANGTPAAAGAIQGPATICAGQTAPFSVPSINNAYTYIWALSPGASIVDTNYYYSILISFSDSAKSGTITVFGTSSNCGNGDTSVFTITVYPSPGLKTTETNASCQTCSNGSASVLVTGGTRPYSYSWSNNATTDTINNLLPGTYSVCISDSFECTTCDSVVISNASGINLIKSNTGISVYPIPNNGQMTVNLNGNGYIAMKIYDELGREIYTKPLYEAQQYQNLNININYVPNGIYFLQILTQNGIIEKSIVVQK
jgi:hypothetical protein